MNRFPFACVAFLFVVVSNMDCAAQQKPIPAFDGSIVLAGRGQTPDYILDAFVQLSGGQTADIMVFCEKGKKKRALKRWRDLGAKSVQVMEDIPTKLDTLVLLMLKCRGVWFERALGHRASHNVFPSLLKDVLSRGGVLGGSAEAAHSIVGKKGGFDFLPGTLIRLPANSGSSGKKTSARVMKGNVEWEIEPRTALILHNGRRAGALGAGKVRVRIAAQGGWPELTKEIKAIDAFDHGDLPPYHADFLGWLRQARMQAGPVFPAEKVDEPRLKRGTLILSGGGGVSKAIFERFIKAAGGKNAVIVCIPSGKRFEDDEEPSSFSAGRLRDMGCKKVYVLHSSDPSVANGDERFLTPLKKATGVWIDGGRTYLVMDCYEDTLVQELIKDVLARKGVVAGSSAGCQVAGEFLLRGNPRTNKDLVFAGYTKGLGFLKGVVLDAHFRQRKRQESFAELLKKHSQLLGIGVDEETAVIVKGSVAEVIGSNAVSFYGKDKKGAQKNSNLEPVVLKAGGRFDLVKRRPLK